ncbi:filamentation induced by cAMP protein fic [Halorubrum salipaludis]|uniref:Filamentation induced by cAMP protein fic n=1 Tax=Halorubrum salipaludis TaxID=2032630 RepID=A0A2A2FG25_9EURY|nr:Fic family protein [Halorubrum salipaludis]PAU83627.1 filamentation induced by cAMP protein fic [Halorubrum salipaludis]
MRERDLGDTAPGTLVSYGRDSYYKPEPLPPSRELDLTDRFYETLADATFWLGQLSGISRELDFPPLLYTSLLRKEAMESAEIEGADIDYNALYSLETRALDDSVDANALASRSSSKTTKDTREVLNYERAVEDGIRAIDDGESLSVDLLHALHETLLSGVPDDRVDTETVGEYKTRPNHLGDFLPPVPGVVDGLMDALMTYYRTGGRYHPLIDIALFHYQFETIHPYGDGNGRLGRLLITLHLYDHGYLQRPNLYLSEYFNRNKPTYVDRMTAVRTDGEWEAWLAFFVEGIAKQAEESVTRTLALDELRRRYENEYGGVAYTKNRLACKLFERPYLTTKTVAKSFDVDHSTASRAIAALEEDGVLEEVTGKARNKEYRAREIFEILERPPQTY